jgi:hypothetical protein
MRKSIAQDRLEFTITRTQSSIIKINITIPGSSDHNVGTQGMMPNTFNGTGMSA